MIYHYNICGCGSSVDGKIRVLLVTLRLINWLRFTDFLEQHIAAIFRVDYQTLKKEAAHISESRYCGHGVTPHKISIFSNFQLQTDRTELIFKDV